MPSPRKVLPLVGRLRPRQLALLAGALFLLDLAVPDPIPFVDETLLGLLTWWLSRRQR